MPEGSSPRGGRGAARPARRGAPADARRGHRRGRPRGAHPRVADAAPLARGGPRRHPPAPRARQRGPPLGRSGAGRPATSTAAPGSTRRWSGRSSTPTGSTPPSARSSTRASRSRSARPSASAGPTAACRALLAGAGTPARARGDRRGRRPAPSARPRATRPRAEAAQRLGAEAVTVDRLDRALRLANAGLALDDSPATRSNLLRVLLRSPGAIGVLNGDGDEVFDSRSAPTERSSRSRDVNGTVTIFDAQTRKRIGVYQASGVEVRALEFAPGSDRLAIVGRELATRARERRAAADHRRALTATAPLGPARRPPGATSPVRSPRATYHAETDAASSSATPRRAEPAATFLRRFDAGSGSPLGRVRRVPSGRRPASALLAAPDGRLVSVGEHMTYAIDGETLRVVRRYRAGAVTAALSAGRQDARAGRRGWTRPRARPRVGTDARAVRTQPGAGASARRSAPTAGRSPPAPRVAT